MLYGITLNVLDFVWVLVAIIGVVTFCGAVSFSWISRPAILVFLVTKLFLGLGFSVSAVLSDVEFDAAGYYVEGVRYAAMFRDLAAGRSNEFITATPFWATGGLSTDRLNSLSGVFLTISGGSFLGMTVFASILGAVGQLFIYRFFRERFPEIRPGYFYPVLFHPSLMVWSAMMLKDTFGILGLGISVYALGKLVWQGRMAWVALLAIGIYVVGLFRSFMFLPLGAFMLFVLWDRMMRPTPTQHDKMWIVKVLYLIAASGMSLLLIWFIARWAAPDLLEQRREGAVIFSQIEAGSSFEAMDVSFSARGLLGLGVGVINGLFRPFPWDVRKPLQAAAALENIVVVWFVIAGLRCYLTRFSAAVRQSFSGCFWGLIAVAIIVACGVGLFASNSGTISRYRVPMIPFLLAAPAIALGLREVMERSMAGAGYRSWPAPARGRRL